MWRVVKALLVVIAAAAPSEFTFQAVAGERGATVCDPPDFRLEPGGSFTAAVDTAAGSVRLGLAVDFPRKALKSLGSAATLTFTDSDSVPLYEAKLSIEEDPSLAGFGERALRLKFDSIAPGGARVPLINHYESKAANQSGGVNCLTAEFADGAVSFSTGGDRMAPAGSARCRAGFAAVRLSVNRPMEVRRMEVTVSEDHASALMTEWTEESLAEYFATSTDPLEGFWSYLDRDNDPQWAILGGFYELAVIKNADTAAYDIIYLSGAEVEGSRWRPGMRKGSLTPTIFADHYRLAWTDARFLSDYAEATADLSLSNTVLTLNFPLHRSQLRFSRRLVIRR
ncbi:MAG: hypothetical protein NC210_04445 [[Clostridium] fimetarium]|nr:hypothetical protein [Alistipes timonensis]MCM1405653.1 hypothetical protein [[Clostridium] fimetarium]